MLAQPSHFPNRVIQMLWDRELENKEVTLFQLTEDRVPSQAIPQIPRFLKIQHS